MSSDVHGDIMYAKDIEARVIELQSIPYRVARDLDEWEEMELTELSTFRAAAIDQYGRDKWLGGMSFISSDYQDTYAANMAQERFGEATQHNAWHDDEWADFYYQDGLTFTLEDTEYWTDGQR